MKLSTIVIDDEQNNLDNLSELIEQYCPQLAIQAKADSASMGLECIKTVKPDLVFLDIQMPEMNGFELLQALNDYNFEVIFVTAFDKYAIQAIRFSAIDYLLKPVNIEELQSAVSRVLVKRASKERNLQLENLMDMLKRSPSEMSRIALPSAKETRFVKIAEIIRCESSNNYTTFYFTNGEHLVVSKPIYEYEEILSEHNFIRCHQSHLLNRSFIRSWVKEDGGYLLLEDKTQIPVSRLKKEMLKNLLW